MRVERAQLPLDPPLGSVNSYIVGKSIIDPGMYSAPAIHALLSAIRRSGLKATEIEKIVITHFHVDHMSALPVLLELSEPEVYMGERDLEIIKRGASLFVEKILETFRMNGMSEEEVSIIRRSHPVMRLKSLYDEIIPNLDIRPLRDGDLLPLGGESFEIVALPGHTPGSIGLAHRDFIFVGDVVIDGITPHVILHDMADDPLGDHLDSLRRLSSLGAITAYSGHRGEIRNLAERSGEIIKAHEERLQEILELLKSGRSSAYEIAKSVKWRARSPSWDGFSPAERFFAMGETLAHLRHLERRGLARSYERGNSTHWEPVP